MMSSLFHRLDLLTCVVSAALLSTLPCASSFPIASNVASSAVRRSTLARTDLSAVVVVDDDASSFVSSHDDDDGGVGRRAFLVASAAATFARPADASDGGGDKVGYVAYEDRGFRVRVPSGWTRSDQELPDRRRIVLFVDPTTSDDADDKTLLFVAYTSVRDDYTSLSSFGTVEQVGQTTILPKSTLGMRTEVSSEMLSSEKRKDAYFFDYTIAAERQPKRHFRTIFALVPGATGGAGSMLVTITAQTAESKYDGATKAVFDEVFDSYEVLK